MDESYKDWSSDESNPIKDIKENIKTIKDSQVNGSSIDPIYKIDFSTIDVEVKADHVNDQGEPRKDVLIYKEKLVCHPDFEDRLKEGLTLFFSNKRWVIPESPQ